MNNIVPSEFQDGVRYRLQCLANPKQASRVTFYYNDDFLLSNQEIIDLIQPFLDEGYWFVIKRMKEKENILRFSVAKFDLYKENTNPFFAN